MTTTVDAPTDLFGLVNQPLGTSAWIRLDQPMWTGSGG